MNNKSKFTLQQFRKSKPRVLSHFSAQPVHHAIASCIVVIGKTRKDLGVSNNLLGVMAREDAVLLEALSKLKPGEATEIMREVLGVFERELFVPALPTVIDVCANIPAGSTFGELSAGPIEIITAREEETAAATE